MRITILGGRTRTRFYSGARCFLRVAANFFLSYIKRTCVENQGSIRHSIRLKQPQLIPNNRPRGSIASPLPPLPRPLPPKIQLSILFCCSDGYGSLADHCATHVKDVRLGWAVKRIEHARNPPPADGAASKNHPFNHVLFRKESFAGAWGRNPATATAAAPAARQQPQPQQAGATPQEKDGGDGGGSSAAMPPPPTAPVLKSTAPVLKSTAPAAAIGLVTASSAAEGPEGAPLGENSVSGGAAASTGKGGASSSSLSSSLSSSSSSSGTPAAGGGDGGGGDGRDRGSGDGSRNTAAPAPAPPLGLVGALADLAAGYITTTATPAVASAAKATAEATKKRGRPSGGDRGGDCGDGWKESASSGGSKAGSGKGSGSETPASPSPYCCRITSATGEELEADAVVVTLPLGVLKAR